jgi:hypothetical protein
MIDGVTSRPFSALTLPPPGVKTSHKSRIIEASRTKFGRPRTEIEREIMTRSIPEEKPPRFQMRIL